MGVLDDAIREHLDLKRRHGAEEDELRRQEEEALGPARREVAPADSADGDQAQAEVEAAQPELSEAIPAEAVRSDVHEEEDDVELHVHDAEPEAFEEAEAGAPAEPAQDELEGDHVALGDTPQAGFARVEEETVPQEEHLPADEPLEDDEAFDDDVPREGDELDDEELEDDGNPDEDADVLEDTPDFLQETPEHDRLWFEQKPPRDFDFD
jgi:hypothetical protein